MTSSSFSLHWLDYVAFILMLCVSTVIGLYFAVTSKRTTKEYLTGDRQLSMIPASLSIVVSYMSAISMLGDTAESYMYGAIYLWQTFAGCIGTVIASYVFIPIFYPLQLTSINKVSSVCLVYLPASITYLVVFFIIVMLGDCDKLSSEN